MDLRRVLLVDDDDLICVSLGKGLERRGYAVTTAESGNRAVAVLEKEPFDIVVADLVMNDVNGLGVLRRSKELRPQTAVIILTAFADLPTAVQALRLGADDYVSKPCDAARLSDTIERCAVKLRSQGDSRDTAESKELLLRESHHRIKNDLLMLSALVGLELPQVKEREDRSLFEELRTRIHALSLVHEELFRGGSYREIGARHFVSELCRRTVRGFNPAQVTVSLHVEAPDEPLPADSATPLALIVVELLTNSLKYAFPPGGSGHIVVTLDREGEDYRLEVRDDGRGLESGAVIDEPTSLGMKIVLALVSELRGAIAYRTESGAVFSLTFHAGGERDAADDA